MLRAAIGLLAATITLAPVAAQTPGFPQTLPPNTVVGRLGISSGPSQAIPFSRLATELSSSFALPVTPENFSATAGQAKNFTDTVTSSSGSTTITTGAAHFAAADVGKLITIEGLGNSVKGARIQAAGAGYTPSIQTLTVSGGTCSVAPTLTAFITAGGAVEWVAMLTPGTCSVQPANPAAVTGGGGAGATFNLIWTSLFSSIATVPGPNQITIFAGTAASGTSVSRNIIYGSDDTSAVNQAVTAAQNNALNRSSSVVGFCGGYILNTSSSVAISIAARDGLSLVGICPGASIYLIGTGNTRAIQLQGTGTGTATTFASNALHGAGSISVTSASGLAVDDYLIMSNSTGIASDARSMTNRIRSISGTTVGLQLPMAFDVNTAQTNSITKFTPAQRITVQDLTFDCMGASGTVAGFVAQYLVDPIITGIRGRNCASFNSQSLSIVNAFGGVYQVSDIGSGQGIGSDAASFSNISAARISYDGHSSNGFGVGINGIAFSELHLKQNGAEGRVLKLFGSCSNWGTIEASGSLPGWIGVGFTAGSCYNDFSSVSAMNSFQCLWSNGTGNVGNTIRNLRLSNCTNAGIVLGATDTGWQIGNVVRDASVAADSIGTTDHKIQTPYLTTDAAPAFNVVGATGITTGAEWTSFANASYLGLKRANGTTTAPTAVTTGNQLSSYSAYGYTGAAYAVGTSLRSYASENFSPTASGSKACIATVLNTTGTLIDRFCVANTGFLEVNGATSGTGTFSVPAVLGTPTWTLPTGSGTFAVSASSPITLNATTGALTLGTVPASQGGTGATALGFGLNVTSTTLNGGLSISGLPPTGRWWGGFTQGFTATSTIALTVDTLYVVPYYIPDTTTLIRIAVKVQTAAAAGKLLRIGIYNWANGVPTSRVLDAGTILADTIGLKEITISQQLTPGWYGLAVVSDGTPTLFGALLNVQTLGAAIGGTDADIGAGTATTQMSRAFTFAALPDPWGTPVYANANAPFIIMRR